MMRRTCLVLILVFVAGLGAAQQAPPPPIFWLISVDVPMSNTAEYDATVREIVGKMRQSEAASGVQFLASYGAETGYSYAIPMQTLGDYDGVMQGFGMAAQAAGVGELLQKAAMLATSREERALRYRPELSYWPEAPSEAEQTGQWRHFNWWYAKPGSEGPIEDVAREFAALYKEKGISTGFRVYEALTGPDLPAYMVAITATDPAGFYADDAALTATLGEAGQALQAKAAGFARRIEMMDLVVRPDLSLAPRAEE